MLATLLSLTIALVLGGTANSSSNKHRTFASISILMRDGIELIGDVYLPAKEGAYPVLVEITPYGRARNSFVDEVEYWTSHGYGYVAVDTRGQGDSEGQFDFFHADIDDGFDVIEWAAAQPWSNGRIGMRGSSYTGTNQWHAAMNRPPHLRCIVPNATVGLHMEHLVRVGGAFKLRWAVEWLASLSDSGVTPLIPELGGAGAIPDYEKLLGARPLLTLDERLIGSENRLFRKFVTNDTFTPYWRQIQMSPENFSRLTIPTLSFSGWFDGTLPGTLWHYQGMRAHSPAGHQSWLIVGPWEHLTLSNGGHDWLTGEQVTRVGEVDIPPNGFIPGKEITRKFYDWCLKGEGRFDPAPVQVYVTGSNVWLELDRYPPLHTNSALYLHTAGEHSLEKPGRLSWDTPGMHDGAARFVYDPTNPVPEFIVDAAGRKIRLQSMPVDVTSIQDRPDVLVYESEPLAAPLTVIGNVVLWLHAASDARDTDFTSHLADVRPDGRAIKLGPQSGANSRARYRHGFHAEELLEPGEPFTIKLDYFDIGHTFLPGHRIRVSISSSNYPWISANPNTGNPIATDTDPPVIANQSIFHDHFRPSRLSLPVVDLEDLLAGGRRR